MSGCRACLLKASPFSGEAFNLADRTALSQAMVIPESHSRACEACSRLESCLSFHLCGRSRDLLPLGRGGTRGFKRGSVAKVIGSWCPCGMAGLVLAPWGLGPP